MKTLYFKTLQSTQLYLKEQLKSKKLTPPVAVVANIQTDGIGSRGNLWTSQKGNLFLSFALDVNELPHDLKLESVSIYFSYILKEILNEYGSKVFLKWPNDFYIDNKKIGGMITNIVDDTLICGVGINLIAAPKEFKSLDITINREILIETYFKNIEKKVLWKQVFSKYKLEFENNKEFFTHSDGKKVSLESSILESDGSLNINGERIYSRR
ncbi:biotin--[acetyl-CoA-carboxylase] ligase [Sulfurimonas autotrophica]|uniref:Biotin/acetyl-CoA-carboxylase ligase n=1 Tax=Sulfurimonas autotrophica (strain ATCC BAA-671 / DSM 16294 / JCM 11897 / OK10) TaxID=563040 RepID=E0UQT6_SULAO|nr:biotin--[acetyl-CoA-carboxylase] ligase [Sulfurimonas autotrophica]ADN08817.1 biotin/acetyl-CoA-carboxylase ligase [Sulfurimonas autotrophica DSM 16294]